MLSLHAASVFPCKLDCPSFSSRQLVYDLSHHVECQWFNSKEVLKLEAAGNWTRDLSNPKRESYPWTTVPLVWLRLVNLLKPYALILSFYHEFVSAGVNDSSQCGLSELQILSASRNFETVCRKPVVQLRELLDRDRRELIQEFFSPWARTIRQDHSPTGPAPALSMCF